MGIAEVVKVKNMHGRITGYRATIGPVTADGATARLADEACVSATRDALDRLAAGSVIRRWRGHVYVVSPGINAWEYWCDTFSADNYRVSMRSTASPSDTVCAALFHLAQNVWAPDVTDDAAFIVDLPTKIHAELLSWFGWQRRYKAARDAGYDDSAARQMASNNIACVVQGGA
jgi:hypothetical protein